MISHFPFHDDTGKMMQSLTFSQSSFRTDVTATGTVVPFGASSSWRSFACFLLLNAMHTLCAAIPRYSHEVGESAITPLPAQAACEPAPDRSAKMIDVFGGLQRSQKGTCATLQPASLRLKNPADPVVYNNYRRQAVYLSSSKRPS